MLNSQALKQRYRQTRLISEQICQPLETEDYQIQSCLETSPPKWHLAHVSWFFETFLLKPNLKGYSSYHPLFDHLFNSYYATLGDFHPRPRRGLLSRPSTQEIYSYRKAIDTAMQQLFVQLEKQEDAQVFALIELGIHHEQQHQELLLMDIKHNFSVNPLQPVYRNDLKRQPDCETAAMRWHEQSAGLYSIGHSGNEFAYDNECPQHMVYLNDYRLANRLVTNEEYLAFIEDQGYQRVDLWLSDGWQYIQQQQWQAPLYWIKDVNGWQEMTLGGVQALQPQQPVCHVSYYEADAYARWAGKRLPTEAEAEVVLQQKPFTGNFFAQEFLHPQAAGEQDQWFGDLWTWTASAYLPYPGFKPFAGSAGEYNGKFMNNQMVLRGGCCATSQEHMRVSYRNFFQPHDRWQFSGIRLADAG